MVSLVSLAIGVGAIIVVGWLSKYTKAGLGLGELAGGIRGIIEQPLTGFGAGISAALSPRIAPEFAPRLAPELVWPEVWPFAPWGQFQPQADVETGNGAPPPANGGAGARNGIWPAGYGNGARQEDRVMQPAQFTRGKQILAREKAARQEDRAAYIASIEGYTRA